jgi:hypothetical protein
LAALPNYPHSQNVIKIEFTIYLRFSHLISHPSNISETPLSRMVIERGKEHGRAETKEILS